MEAKKQSWKEATIAGIITKPRSALEYKTGAWRSQTPVIDHAKCTKCLMCWIYCPEPTIIRVVGDSDKGVEINQEYCKGCGICAQVCPVKCIEMRQG